MGWREELRHFDHTEYTLIQAKVFEIQVNVENL